MLYPYCAQFFLPMCYYGPYTLVANSKFLSCTCLLTFFVNNSIMTGEPTHTASEMAPHARAPQLYQLLSEK